MTLFSILKNYIRPATVIPLSDEDIDKLAKMSEYCRATVTKNGIFCTKYYAYYIPQDERDIETAKKMFEQHGIRMRVHNSRIFRGYRKKVLRINYSDVANKRDFRQIMKKLEQRYTSMYELGLQPVKTKSK